MFLGVNIIVFGMDQINACAALGIGNVLNQDRSYYDAGVITDGVAGGISRRRHNVGIAERCDKDFRSWTTKNQMLRGTISRNLFRR